MKLSKREKAIHEAMAEGGEWCAEDIAGIIWDSGDLPKHWRATISGAMVLLCAKTKALEIDPCIEKVSGEGRGAIATYSAVKRRWE